MARIAIACQRLKIENPLFMQRWVRTINSGDFWQFRRFWQLIRSTDLAF
jgi:hypothetical protein